MQGTKVDSTVYDTVDAWERFLREQSRLRTICHERKRRPHCEILRQDDIAGGSLLAQDWACGVRDHTEQRDTARLAGSNPGTFFPDAEKLQQRYDQLKPIKMERGSGLQHRRKRGKDGVRTSFIVLTKLSVYLTSST